MNSNNSFPINTFIQFATFLRHHLLLYSVVFAITTLINTASAQTDNAQSGSKKASQTKTLANLAIYKGKGDRVDSGSDHGFVIGSGDFATGRLVFSFEFEKDIDIYTANLESKIVKPLINSPKVDEYPNWSPDGTKVLFYSDMSGDREIYVINSDGSNLTKLTNSTGIDEDPDWSPNGKNIVFHSERIKKGSSNIFIMDADGTNLLAITNQTSGKRNTVPKWSPRGDEIVYATSAYWPGWDIMIYSFITKKSELLTSGRGSFCRGSWDSTGSRIAFSYGIGNKIDLYTIDKGKTVAQSVTKLAGREYDPVWNQSDDGLFFTHETAPNSGVFVVSYLNLKTKEINQVLSASGSIRHISWTPFIELPPKPTPPVETPEAKTETKQDSSLVVSSASSSN